ncbi:MAG: 2Fe-2S iron-sulfur cluster-binding protein [Gallionella sp.]
MPKISYQALTVLARDDETVLEACLRGGLSLPFSCRAGTCHSCLSVAATGDIPIAAQRGLTPEQVEQSMFLPCLCVASGDMTLLPAVAAKLWTGSVLQGKKMLTAELGEFLLEPTLPVACAQGEVIKLRSPAGQVYSARIENQPSEDYFLAIHVARVSGDAFNDWLFTQLPVDGELQIQGVFAPDTLPTASPSAAKYPPTDALLWAALQEGKLLREILLDFYTRVYQDPLLSPYFHGITMQRSMEKVYSFMQQVCTGENSYFGERPKNAHHWMVISDEIFSYRENLMRECQQRAGLSAAMSQRWFAIENFYKSDIVKAAPIPRQFAGRELPLDGYGEMVLDTGAICDGCARVIESGESIRYHLRLGTVYCTHCQAGLQ